MMRRTVSISLLALLAGVMALSALAQNPRQARGGGPGSGVGAATIVTLEGVVDSVNAAYGQGTPSFTMTLKDGKKVTVIIGPYWLLAGSKIQIQPGSRLSVQAILSRFENTYAAVEITDPATGETLTLRDASGRPRWAGGHFGQGTGNCLGQDGQPVLDPAKKAWFDGVVESVNMGVGQGFPNFMLGLADGKKVTIVASPFRTVQDANFKIAIGDKMSVLAYPSLRHEGVYVAQEIKNLSTGSEITLRDDAGIPIGGRAGRCAGCVGPCPGPGR